MAAKKKATKARKTPRKKGTVAFVEIPERTEEDDMHETLESLTLDIEAVVRLLKRRKLTPEEGLTVALGAASATSNMCGHEPLEFIERALVIHRFGGFEIMRPEAPSPPPELTKAQQLRKKGRRTRRKSK